MSLVELDALGKRHLAASKDVQGAANCKIDMSTAECVHLLERRKILAAACVRDVDGAPLCEFAYEILIDTGL
jgi:hypothetical protein